MLVFYVAEYLLDDVFEAHDAARAAKLVDHNAETLLFLKENLHQLLGCHGLGNKRHLPYKPSQGRHFAICHFVAEAAVLGFQAEHLRRMYVSDDVVNVFLVDNHFAMTALHEYLQQLVDAAFDADGMDFGTRYHAVAHLGIRKVERVLEDFDFIFNLVVTLGVVNARLKKIVEVNLCERVVVALLLHPYAEKPEQSAREQRGKSADGPQQYVEHVCQWCKKGKHTVGIALEQSLWKELAGEQHHKC